MNIHKNEPLTRLKRSAAPPSKSFWIAATSRCGSTSMSVVTSSPVASRNSSVERRLVILLHRASFFKRISS
jgi:hypothetical protein